VRFKIFDKVPLLVGNFEKLSSVMEEFLKNPWPYQPQKKNSLPVSVQKV
jgi:hypothetical protein